MRWKQGLFGIVLTAIIVYYFLILGVFTFCQQEEAQLFIPAWWNIKQLVCEPGGFCSVVGQYLIMLYKNPICAVASHVVLLVTIAFLIWQILDRIALRGYHLLLASVPIFYLMKESILYIYVIDGTVGITIMMSSLYIQTRLRRSISLAFYGLFSTGIMFFLTGELAVIYAIFCTLLPLLFFQEKNHRLQGLWSLLPALFFLSFSDKLGISVPLQEGLRPVQFLETQQQPIYYIYHVWISFSARLLVLITLAFLFVKLPYRTMRMKVVLSLFSAVFVVVQSASCLPKRIDIQNYLLNELAYFASEGKWDSIIHRFHGKQISEYVSLNYLNYALSKRGELAERMFEFDQRGSKSLVMPWTQTFFDSKLLCDIHFHIGDLSLAEGYAFEAMALSQRKGCITAMQRLAQINLLKAEYAVARKYISILSEVPAYKEWADRQMEYICHPENMKDDAELKNKQRSYMKADKLLFQMSVDSLWQTYIPEQKNGWEYCGCYYLADKKLKQFSDFILKSCSSKEVQLPRYFQEAWLLITDLDASLPAETFAIRPEIEEKYRQFCQARQLHAAEKIDTNSIYRSFGDTYWFYYYFKLFKNR